MASKLAPIAINTNPYEVPAFAYWKIRHMRIEAGLDQQDEVWLNWRNQGIGSSDVGSVMSLNPHKSGMEVWREKAGKKSGQTNRSDNANTARGKQYEPFVRSLYSNLTGWPLVPLCAVHDEVSWARVSLDGIRDDHRFIVEIKCPRSHNWIKMREAGTPHDYWKAQVAYQLWVTGAPLAHILVYDADDPDLTRPPGDRLMVFEYERDHAFERAMVDALTEFWGYVERKEEPPRSWYRGQKVTVEKVLRGSFDD